MKILVLIKTVEDTKIPLECHRDTGRPITAWNVTRLNPPDQKALDIAFSVRKRAPDTHITLIHLGPAGEEGCIRDGIALGADEGLRIWEDGLNGSSVSSKALIFARTAQILGFDLIVAGNKSNDTMSGQLGTLLASHLNLPVINAVADVTLSGEEGKITAVRSLSKGYKERTECPLPLVMTTEAGDKDTPENYAALSALSEAYEREIPCWDLSEIGIPTQLIREKNALLTSEPMRFPEPRLRTIPAPDSALPAFARIKQLVEGTIKPRQGKVVRADEDSIVEEIFQVLLKEGWLDHLQIKKPLRPAGTE